ncbi:hypothetical protein FACS1894219_10590 [Clostridia bacterium]|nr:hypothetical protein FACS1894219_10590 [Clostridia bacterium]
MYKIKYYQRCLTKTGMIVKAIICLLCMSVLSSLLIFDVYAADTAVINVGRATGKPGESVTVAISLTSNPGIAGLRLNIEYDNQKLRLDGVDAVKQGTALRNLSFIGVSEISYKSNPFSVLWYGAVDDKSTGEVLYIRFTILNDTPSGAAFVTVSCSQKDSINRLEEIVPLQIAQGTISVSDNSDVGTPTPSQDDHSDGSPTYVTDDTVQYVDTESLPKSIQPLVEDERVFVISGEQDREKVIVSIPHIVNADNPNGSIVIYKIEEDGSLDIVQPSRYNGVTGMVDFVGYAGSFYYIGVNHVEFIDVTTDKWYYNAISFVAARKIFIGVGGSRFAPDITMSRAMFVTALANLDKADLSTYKNSPFSDVSINAWYGPYVAWAAQIGIINEGILSRCKPGNFNPEDDITREEMAVIFANYIKAKGLILAERRVETFTDLEQASDWGREAIQVMREHSIVDGVGGNLYSPKSTATRAEVAQIFRNLISAMIS